MQKFYSEDIRLKGETKTLKRLQDILRAQWLQKFDNDDVLKVAFCLHEIEDKDLAEKISEALSKQNSHIKDVERKFDALMEALLDWFNYNSVQIEQLGEKKKESEF